MRTLRPLSEARPRSLRLCTPVPLVLVALSGLAAAQGGPETYFVSTSSDAGVLASGLPFLEDGDLVSARTDSFPRPLMQSAHWRAVGDLVPSEIDALALEPGAGSFSERLRFSTLSDVGGFRDGDVLGLAPGGGWRVVTSEDVLASALNTANALDLDGFTYDDAGALVFSLQSNIDSGVFGAVSNGDVLRFDGAQTERLYTESDIDAALSTALGNSASASDVHGLDWLASELRVVVQSPSEADGGLLRVGASPALVVGDTDLGLGGAELDAIASAPDDAPRVEMWFEPGATSGSGTGVVQGPAGGLVAIVPTAGVGFEPALYMPGFGAFYLDPFDPSLLSFPLAVLDGTGRWSASVQLPLAAAGPGWDGLPGFSFQALQLGVLDLSAPLRIDF